MLILKQVNVTYNQDTFNYLITKTNSVTHYTLLGR